jgi:hypothetical protein
MARSCTVCIHRNRDGMDKLLLRGEQLKSVARRYSVSEDALGRQKKHMQVVIAKAATSIEQKDLAYGSALLAEIGCIRADAERRGCGTSSLSRRIRARAYDAVRHTCHKENPPHPPQRSRCRSGGSRSAFLDHDHDSLLERGISKAREQLEIAFCFALICGNG